MQEPINISIVRYIILDLGGVLFNIRSVEDWIALYIEPLLGRTVDHGKFQDIYLDNERGKIPPSELKSALETLAGKALTMEQVEHAWNGILLDMPERNMDILRRLAGKYPLYLLSNANAVHVKAWWKIIHDNYGQDAFTSVFRKLFLSHEIGFVKPSPEIYEIAHHRIGDPVRSSCLFFDDKAVNVAAAREFGWQALNVLRPLDELVDDIGLLA